MELNEARKLKNGLYLIHWKMPYGGGHSLAAVGHLHHGDPWFACCNWTGSGSSDIASQQWQMVERVELIRGVGDGSNQELAKGNPVQLHGDEAGKVD